MNSRTVILIELTCCAEEGVAAAQARKEARYEDLLTTIRETKMWTARLLTVEVGARGLVGSSTYRAFVTLGLSSRQANALCKRLSVVVARCSYAIYLAHNSKEWPHNNNLVELTDSSPIIALKAVPKANIVALRENHVKELYHFTDASNLESIRKNGLMSASTLSGKAIKATMNSSEASRALDAKAGLENYVRLSFCSQNPMQFVAQKEGRIASAVTLRVKLEVVSRPGVLFSDCNATKREAQIGKTPDIVRFDVVQAKSYFDVPELLRKHFLAEVLVPSPRPPHLVTFPDQKTPQPALTTPPLNLMTTSSTNPQPTTVDVAPATPRPANVESPPIARLSPCRAPDGMIASPSASLVHRKYVFQGDVICECGETGCEIATRLPASEAIASS